MRIKICHVFEHVRNNLKKVPYFIYKTLGENENGNYKTTFSNVRK